MQTVFEEASIPKAVASMAVPTILGMLVVIFYNMADTFFVGQTGDPNQVAAVSLTMPVFMILMGVGNVFGIGGSPLISRLLGENNKAKLKKVSSFCFYCSVMSGITLTFLLLFFMPTILSLIGCSPNTELLSENYLKWIAWGAVFIVVSSAFGNMVRGEGAANVAMIGMMIGTLLNIVLDAVMILYLGWGVEGAAIATVIGNLAATLYYMHYLLRGKTLLSVSIKDFSISDKIPSQVLSIGVPAAITNILMSLSNIIMNNLLITYGDNAVAAMGVAMKANMMVIMVQIGMSMGVQPLLAYSYGARDRIRINAILKFSILCNILMGSVLTIIYFTFTRQIISVFINDSQVIEYGIVMLKGISIVGPFVGIFFIFSSYFQAMGKAMPALILSLSRQGLVYVPLLFVSNYFIGITGLIYSQAVADFMCLLLSFVMFRSINKKEYK